MLTGIKDLDREILKYIDDGELLKVCSINKIMYYKVCDDNFLKRKLSKYPNIEKYKNEESWKTFFSIFTYKFSKLKQDFQFTYTEGNFNKQHDLLIRNNAYNIANISCGEGEPSLIKYCLERKDFVRWQLIEMLKIASEKGHLHIVKFFIEGGLDVHSENDAAIRYAVRCGHYEIFQYLVDQGADIHIGNDSSLRLAAMYGHHDMVKYLVEHGANIAYMDNAAIHFARKHKHFEIVRYLNECLIEN